MTTLYDYGRWANGRILDTAAALTPEQLVAAVAVGGSLRDILVHTMATQWLWLSRCQGISPRAVWDAGEFPDLVAVRERWEEVERATAAFVGGLTDNQLGHDVSYTPMRGGSRTQPLWQLYCFTRRTMRRSTAARPPTCSARQATPPATSTCSSTCCGTLADRYRERRE